MLKFSKINDVLKRFWYTLQVILPEKIKNCKIFQNKTSRRILAGAAVLLFIFAGLEVTGYILAGRHHLSWPDRVKEHRVDKTELAKWVKNNKSLKKNIERLQPQGTYIVIDTANNKLYLKKGDKTVRTAVVSCGSGSILQDPGGDRRWVFDTPRGQFSVISKIKDPVWLKPDWAFIEEGEDIPSKKDERLEEGMMGDYAMGFGDGYFIHGTLYTRMLGRNVTHGCIRVGDEDLEAIFKAVPPGSKIFIY